MTELEEQARRTSLAGRLKTARKLADLKVAEAATRLGWSWQKVYRLERGDQTPTALELQVWALLTGQPLDFFLGNTSSADTEAPSILSDQPGGSQAAVRPPGRARAGV